MVRGAIGFHPTSGEKELQFFEEEYDHAEEYLESLAMYEERGRFLVPVSDVAAMLRIKAPSAVQMLKRLARDGLVDYVERQGVKLTAKGRRVGRRMVRNGRLMEAFMVNTLKLPLDLKVAHGAEHSLSDRFADALCTMMGHPAECPHGYPMPPGKCCPKG